MTEARFAWRTFRKSPGVIAVVVLSLAIGIGANTTIFTLINGLFLTALPVENPAELVLFSDGRARGVVGGQNGAWAIFPYKLWEMVRQDQKSWRDVAAFRTQIDRLSLRQEGQPAQLAQGRLVSGNYFAVMGVPMAQGRPLSAADDDPAAAPAAVISHDYWQRAFAGSPAAIGRAVRINDVGVVIAGVARPGFFGESIESQMADIWLPLRLQPEIMRRRNLLEDVGNAWLNMVGRLQPGVTSQQAQASVNVMFQNFLREHGAKVLPGGSAVNPDPATHRIELTPGKSGVSNVRLRYGQALPLLLSVVGVLLLIACANVANVLLARAAGRRKEMSIRLAIGAGRMDVFRQVIVESGLLAVMGGALGLLLSAWGSSLLVATVSTGPTMIPVEVRPDLRVLGFTAALTLAAALLVGIAPALQSMKADVAEALKSGSSVAGKARRISAPKLLVVLQVALSLPLLVLSSILLASLRHLENQDLGFQQDSMLEVGMETRLSGMKPEDLPAFYDRVLQRVQNLPGVKAASVSLYSPMSGENWSAGNLVEGYTPPPGQAALSQFVFGGPRYVETLGMKLVAGRDIDGKDLTSTTRVAVVNEDFAEKYLKGRNPLGVRFHPGGSKETPAVEIVGVVKNFKFNDPKQKMWPAAIFPITQAFLPPAQYAGFLEVRANGNPVQLTGQVRQALTEIARDVPLTTVRTLDAQIGTQLVRERLIARISSFVGLVALALACLGLYGVLSNAVARRTREIGIRMALGARAESILKMVLREAGLLVIVGAIVGLAASIGAGSLIKNQIYGVQPADPLNLTLAVVGLLLAAAIAAWAPARRATRVDPMVALRMD
ncbi:MAG: ABC transporter permease [Bryobacteraceae bacterium]|nr:ABC transporter permease [Bryobacteraceae bacterium]